MSSSQAKAQEATAPQFYMVELHGTRAGWPENMTKDEERVLGEHFVYLKELTAKGKVLMAGPVWGKFGLIVLKVQSEAELKDIMEKEPSVVQNVHTYEYAAMVPAADSRLHAARPISGGDFGPAAVQGGYRKSVA